MRFNIQSTTTIFEVSSSVLNWLVELICTVFDILHQDPSLTVKMGSVRRSTRPWRRFPLDYDI